VRERRGCRVEAGCIRLGDGATVPFDEAVWAAGPGAPRWAEETGLDLADGFVAVIPACARPTTLHLRRGDVATTKGEPRPKAGVFAVRQAPRWLKTCAGRSPAGRCGPHVPQRRFLSLVGTGDRTAVADWGAFAC
jgi:selenide,water dikinase